MKHPEVSIMYYHPSCTLTRDMVHDPDQQHLPDKNVMSVSSAAVILELWSELPQPTIEYLGA